MESVAAPGGVQSLLPWLIGSAVLIVLGLVTYAVWKQAEARRTDALFAAGADASVYAKRTHTWTDRIGYYVSFHVTGHHAIEVEVPHDWFAHLNPGDRGILTLRNGQFQGFTRAG